MTTGGKMRIDELAGQDALTYQTLTDLPEVAEIAPAWNALLSESSCNRAFSAPEWFIATCRYHPSMRPQVIVARRGSALVGILPLVLVEDGKVAAFPNHFCDYSDMIVAPDDSVVPDDSVAMEGLLRHAVSSAHGYKRLRLSRVRRDSNCLRAARALGLSSIVDWHGDESGICHYIALPDGYEDGYEEYLATRASRFRKSIRQSRRWAERANVTISELQPEDFPASQVPETFLSLLLSRHTGRSSFNSPVTQAVFRDVLPALYLKRSLRVFAAFEARKMIGIDLCMLGANSLCAWNGGFLLEAAHWSPGKLLTDYGIRCAFEMNLAEYDFLRGDEPYKASWANHSRDIGRLEFDVIGIERQRIAVRMEV